MSRVLLASNNKKKLEELRRILTPIVPGIEVLGLGDVPPYDEPAETEPTFEGNALLKAHAALAATGLLASTRRVRVELFGSLGATGHGHGSDRAVLWGLTGLDPETIDTDAAPGLAREIVERGRIDRQAGAVVALRHEARGHAPPAERPSGLLPQGGFQGVEARRQAQLQVEAAAVHATQLPRPGQAVRHAIRPGEACHGGQGGQR